MWKQTEGVFLSGCAAGWRADWGTVLQWMKMCDSLTYQTSSSSDTHTHCYNTPLFPHRNDWSILCIMTSSLLGNTKWPILKNQFSLATVQKLCERLYFYWLEQNSGVQRWTVTQNVSILSTDISNAHTSVGKLTRIMSRLFQTTLTGNVTSGWKSRKKTVLRGFLLFMIPDHICVSSVCWTQDFSIIN